MNDLVHTLVKDCMIPFLITVSHYDTLARAYELMTLNQIRRLPVLDDKQLVGIITLSDLLAVKPSDPARRVPLDEVAISLSRLVVSTGMSKDPICIFDYDTLGHAAELMLEHKIGGLPVVDAGRHVVGLITESNVFRLIAKRWHEDNLLLSGARVTD